jgi:hypothetical protein
MMVMRLIWSEYRDCGATFDAEVGVYRVEDHSLADKFVAYVYDWGGGIRSMAHPDAETARADIPRLWDRYYGEGA